MTRSLMLEVGSSLLVKRTQLPGENISIWNKNSVTVAILSNKMLVLKK